MAGERLYIDLLDINPPLIFIMNLVPAALAEWIDTSAPTCLLLCVGFLCLWVSVVSFRILDKVGAHPGSAAFRYLVPLLCVVAGYDFAQREHLMAVSAIPYLLLAVLRIRMVKLSWHLWLPVTLVAALGFAIKPYFLAIPAMVELYIAAHRGLKASFRDELVYTMVGVWVCYGAITFIFFPDFLRSTIPLIFNNYLGLGQQSALSVLLLPEVGSIALVLMPLAYFGFKSRRDPLTGVFSMATAGAFISAMAQHKGWSYHLLPAEMFASGAYTLVLARWAEDSVVPTAKIAARNTLPIFICCGLAIYSAARSDAPWREINYSSSDAATLTSWLKEHAPRGRILALTPDIWPIFPAVNYAEARTTLRTMNLWLLQGLYRECLPNGQRYRKYEEMNPAERELFNSVAESLRLSPPSAILIDHSPGIPWCGEEFDFLIYFSAHPEFENVMKRYHMVDDFLGYRMYIPLSDNVSDSQRGSLQ
jgi:hypothetical protein